MFYIQLTLCPTAGLTFRQLPGSILHIATYPFVPPTTLSGFLRRLQMIADGRLPEDVEPPAQRARNPAYWTLPRGLCALGAYPQPPGAWAVHTTRRQGIRAFKHRAFSKIFREKGEKEDYQLHTWDYLFADTLHGFVVAADSGALAPLRSLVNFGGKLGKEGYAFIESVSEARPLSLQRVAAVPSTVVPGPLLVGIPANVQPFPLYRYAWEDTALDFGGEGPSPIAGFVPCTVGLVASQVTLDYLTDGTVFIPQGLVDLLQEGG